MTFEDEVKSYSIDELQLIVSTQKDLYSEEEMSYILEQLAQKKQQAQNEREAEILDRLPEEILCEKCDGPNSFSNKVCVFCGHELDKSKYYSDDYYEADEIDEEDTDSKSGKSYTFQYIISFLIPLVGFIVGGILLANDDEEKISCGKACIIIGIISLVICAVVTGLYWGWLLYW